ncbi:hypothetical protein MTQ01_06155 [Streptomyces sp. XM4193]|uniref:hypothetical protein n=1 Tax=Streptomyces sp. XM4193 TaxID=2929782 RepID=UPI001FF7C919|nr:hypothetical protein [Streptomyces sp. XM4193]MCK1795597.1 hypothetical protein [Streptomyces sp. XM4193]
MKDQPEGPTAAENEGSPTAVPRTTHLPRPTCTPPMPDATGDTPVSASATSPSGSVGPAGPVGPQSPGSNLAQLVAELGETVRAHLASLRRPR